MMQSSAPTRRAVARLLLAALLSSSALAHARAPAEADIADIDLAGTRLGFASQEETRAALQEDDAWLAATSPFQRAATMGLATREANAVGDASSMPRFKEFLASTAQSWDDKEHRRWQTAVKALAPRLAALSLSQQPRRIQLALTDGRDAANTPYTRGATIYLPRGYANGNTSDIELLAHEYFHVLTRENPALAQRLYQLLGFTPAGELEWPAEWLPARIANPDAPFSRHAMALKREGGTTHVMPLLVAHRTTLDAGESFFNVLEVRLLVIKPGVANAPSRALRDANGKLQWIDVSQSPDYLMRLGGNTHYVFHPEETAADNFAYLVSGRKVRNPELLAQFARMLRTP